MESRIQLGDVVKDTISGFKGTAVAVTFWMANCIRISVAANSLKKDGTTIDNQCFDEPQLTVIKAINAPKKKKPTGGDQPMQSRTGF